MFERTAFTPWLKVRAGNIAASGSTNNTPIHK